MKSFILLCSFLVSFQTFAMCEEIVEKVAREKVAAIWSVDTIDIEIDFLIAGDSNGGGYYEVFVYNDDYQDGVVVSVETVIFSDENDIPAYCEIKDVYIN